MNAPLPDHVLRALQTASLDDNAPRALLRRNKYRADGAASRSGFGDQRVSDGGAV